MKSSVFYRNLLHVARVLGLGLILLAPASHVAFADNGKDKKENAADDSFGPDDSDAEKGDAGKAGLGNPTANPALQKQIDLFRSIAWQEGPTTCEVGMIGEIKIPAGYRFTGGDGARKWSELNGNPSSSSEMGVLLPKKGGGWFIIFSYDDSGHVADDEKTALDADKLLASLRENQEAANEMRKARGFEPLQLTGWSVPPSYEDGTHHLVWGLRVADKSGESINYNTKILGRTGVMSANLVVNPDKFDSALAPSRELLAGYQFKSGSKYSEWRAGDKIAQYGLTGLITGGLVVGAAKFGLLKYLGIFIAKFAKAIILGIVALGAAIGKFFGNIKNAIFGRRR